MGGWGHGRRGDGCDWEMWGEWWCGRGDAGGGGEAEVVGLRDRRWLYRR